MLDWTSNLWGAIFFVKVIFGHLFPNFVILKKHNPLLTVRNQIEKLWTVGTVLENWCEVQWYLDMNFVMILPIQMSKEFCNFPVSFNWGVSLSQSQIISSNLNCTSDYVKCFFRKIRLGEDWSHVSNKILLIATAIKVKWKTFALQMRILFVFLENIGQSLK